MKSHKYWSIGALVSMIGTCYTGYKNMKSAHKYCAFSSLICMAMAIDLSGRPYYGSDLTFTCEKIGDMDTEMVREFFYAISYSAGMNLHFKQLSGVNNHHIAECAFKAFAKALDMATSLDERITGVLSTKGSL